MSFKEVKINSKVVFNGKVLKVCEDEVSLPDKSVSKREIVRHNGGACVLFVKDGKIALVNQFRYALNKCIYELPAGKLDLGEEPISCAVRELEEETGYRALDTVKLCEIYPSPGYTDEIIHCYLVRNATFVGEKCDDGEFLSCNFYSIDYVLKMIDTGEITDAKTVVSIYKYLLELRKD